VGFLSPASGINTPSPLNPQQQAQYAAAALALTQQAMNPQAPQAQSAPTAPSGSGNQQIPTFQGPTVNVPPQQQPPTSQQSSAIQPPPPQPGGGAVPSFAVPAIPTPGQPDNVTPSTSQAAQIMQNYPDAPGVQSAMMTLQGDKPTYHAPQYKPPNKWAELGSALLGLAFSSAPIGKFAAGFSGGLSQGAEDRYKREEGSAQNQYSSELNQQLADEKQAGLAITYADTQARIQATERENEIRNRISEERVGLTRQRLDEYIKHTSFSDRLAGARLRQQYTIAEQHMAVTLRGQDLSAGTRVMAIQAEMARTAFVQMATDRRFSGNLAMRQAAIDAGKAGREYNQGMIALRSPKNTMTPEQKNAAADVLTKQYNDSVQSAIGSAAASAPGSDVDKLSTLMTGMDAQNLQDDTQELNAETGGALSGQSYDVGGGGSGQPITINVQPGGGNADGSGSGKLPWWQQPIDAGHEPPPQKGPGVPTGAGQPGSPMDAAPPGPEGHPQRLQQEQAAYAEHLGQLAAGSKLGTGPGVPDPAFKAAREYVAQHAAEYPTAQALLDATVKDGPQMAAQLSKAQAAQLLETWAHTRRSHGEPVDIPPPPGQAQPSAPAGGGGGGFGLQDAPHGFTGPSPSAGTSGKPIGAAPEGLPLTHATAMATPTKGEVVTMAAQKYHIPVALLAAVIETESGGNNQAVSSAGAIGAGQLMPDTARGLGVDPHNPVDNITGAAHNLATLLKKFGSIPLAAAGYNSGAGNVIKYRGIPPFPETRAYVAKVVNLYRSLLATSTASGNF
jgi:hypothetical protein